MTSRHPPIGAFLRPVGNYLYCLRVTEVHSRADGLHDIETERWGMEQKQPVRDGHQYRGITRKMRQVLPGVWRSQHYYRSDWAQRCEPLYYRLIENPKPHSTSNQLEIF